MKSFFAIPFFGVGADVVSGKCVVFVYYGEL